MSGDQTCDACVRPLAECEAKPCTLRQKEHGYRSAKCRGCGIWTWRPDKEGFGPDCNPADAVPTLSQIVEALEGTYRPDGVIVWLDGHNALLDGDRPIDLLLRGEYRRVHGLALALADGIVA